VSTIDLRIDYLRPGGPKTLTCESTVSRMGNRVASVDSKIFHPDAPTRLIATGKAVYNVKRRKERE
jgi:acyl-coenzyme A thioesterase PaaI-like protein